MKHFYFKKIFFSLCLLLATGILFKSVGGTASNEGNAPKSRNASTFFTKNTNENSDITPPTIIANDITVFTRDDRCSAVVENYDLTITDASGIQTQFLNFQEGTVFPKGVSVVTVFARDNAGNVATDSFTVTVIDNVAPSVEAGNMQVFLDENGQAGLSNISAPELIFFEDFEQDTIGRGLESLINWNVISGNVDVLTGVNRALPTTDISLSLVGDTNGTIESIESVILTPGNYRLRVDYRGASGEDASFSVQIGDVLDDSITDFVNEFFEPAEFDFVVTETTTASIRFTEFGGGNPTSGTNIDNVRLLRQPDFSVYDNCQVTNVTVSQSDFTADDLGINPVTITVADAAGNRASTEIEVEVIDNTPPTIVANDMTVFTRDDRCSAVVENYGVTANDASGIQNLFFDFVEGTVFSTGTTEVAVTAEDNAGNIGTETFIVTVIDNVAPTVEANSITLALDENGAANLAIPLAPQEIFSDDFESEAPGLDLNELNGWNVTEGNIDVFFAGQFGLPISNNGLELSGNINGAVESKNSILFEPGNYRLRLDYRGVTGDAAIGIEVGALLDVSITEFVNEFYEPAEFDFTVTETTSATIRFYEFGGDFEFSGTLIDNVRILRQPDSDLISSVYDNCQVTDISISQSDFTSEDLGTNLVTITVSDAAGNTTSTEIEVEVIDNIPPVIIANDITVFTRDDRCSAVVDNYDLTITDASGIQTQFLNFQEGTVFPTGVTQVSVFARDNAGNVSTDSFTVTVIDNVAPTIEASGMQLFLDENGQASLSNISAPELIFFEDFEDDTVGRGQVALTNWNVVDGNVDVFTGVNRALPTTNIALALVGDTNGSIESKETVTLTPGNYRLRVDYHGSSSEDASFNVQIGDVLNDSITDFVNEFFEPAEFDFVVTETITAPIRFTEFGEGNPDSGTIIDNVRLLRQPDFNVYDNCQVTDITVSQSDFTCDDLGVNVVTITVADAAGNTTSAEIEVEVIDNIAPVAVAKNITVALGPDGTVTIDPSDIDYGSSDNCDFTLSLSKTTFDCGDVSRSYRRSKKSKNTRNSVILTVTDAAGNSSSATAFVRVIDNQGPVFSQEPITIYVTGKYSERLTRAEVASRISDNCRVGNFTFSGKRFTTKNKGLNRVRVTAFDRSGNKRLGSILVNVVELDHSLRYVELCYRGRTIKVRPTSVQRLIRRGATFGSCSDMAMVAAPKTNVIQEVLSSEPLIELSAYPNPVKSVATITFSSNTAGRSVLTLFNSGRPSPTVLFDQEIEADTNQKVTFDANGLSNGVYILRLRTAQGVKTMKLLVRR